MNLVTPRSGEITLEDLEKHLLEECGLTVRTEEELGVEDRSAFLEQLPDHKIHTATIDTDPGIDRAAWYEQEDYDRVLVCKSSNRPSATINLLRQCVRFNCRQVSGVFRSTGYYCMRVREYYVEV